MSIDRRQFVAGGAAFACLAALPAGAASHSDPGLRALLDDFAERALRLSPAAATSLGLDTGARVGLKSRLDAVSGAARAASWDEADAMRRALNSVPRAGLTGREATQWDTAAYALDLGRAARAFAFGGNGLAPLGGGALPYVVSQQNGAFSGVPEFLNAQHRIETAADAEAYLARTAALAGVLDAESAVIAEDAAAGVRPPDFVLDKALAQLRAARGVAAGEQGLVTSLARRTTALGLTGDWQGRAVALVKGEVLPALSRQITALERARAGADDRAGVWKLPHGGEYYAWALKVGTTTDRSADTIHADGLEQGRAIQAEMDGLLRGEGLTRGSVGERLSELTADKRYIYEDSAAGRAQLIAYVNERLAASRPMMAKLSRLGLKAPVEVKRVPAEIEAGASLGYMNFASLDGKRPAIYYINLRSMGNWPKWTLPTLTIHEALPGHAWQGAYLAERSSEIPLIASLTFFNAFIEGWALYSEQLADEGGFYEGDPRGRIGYLAAQNFRAARLVVDTGLHHKRWTRGQAIDWMVAQTGRARDAVTSEIDRYCVSPGQACGYKVGHNEIVRLRAGARAKMGARFDLAGFNDAIVATGGVPMAVLGPVIDRWAAGG